MRWPWAGVVPAEAGAEPREKTRQMSSLEAVFDNRDANSNSPPGGLREPPGQIKELGVGTSAKSAAILLLPIVLSACAGGDEGKPITYTDDRGVSNQPYPGNYRTEVLAFMRTYLNNPAGLHDAAMAEPVQRIIGGRLRYVVCLRFAAKESDGGYREPRERAILFVDGRLDRLAENAGEPCAGAVYAAYPEMEKLTR
jgi:hypothetical protein